MGLSVARAGAKGGGRLAGRYELKQNADINVTPFVDVMLVLLIVMMVTAPLATVAVKLDAPPADGHASAIPPTFVSVTEHGLFLTSGGAARQTSLGALPAWLSTSRTSGVAGDTVQFSFTCTGFSSTVSTTIPITVTNSATNQPITSGNLPLVISGTVR